MDLGIPNLTDAEVIGRGGFSVVYSATDTRFDRRVAVKVLNGVIDERTRQRFERECRVMGRLSSHPNVVTVYDAGQTPDGHPYLVMELMAGGTLGDRLRSGEAIDWRRAVAWMVPVLDALHQGHLQGVLHRDVKPENVLIDPAGLPRLTDFGIAIVRDAAGATSTNITASWLHTAPETFANQRDERSDLYSAGSTLHTLITGRPPFWRAEDESLNPLLLRLLHEPPPPLPAHLAPPALSQLVLRSLAKNPADRPATCRAFADELERIAVPAPSTQPFPPLAAPGPPTPAPAQWAPQPAPAAPAPVTWEPPTQPAAPAPSTWTPQPVAAPPVFTPPLPSPSPLPSGSDGQPDGRRGPERQRLSLVIGAVTLAMAVAIAGVVVALTRSGDDPGRTDDTTAAPAATDTVASNVPATTAVPVRNGLTGELIDAGTLSLGPPEHLDPALNSFSESYQIANALYDSLTDIDSSDPANPRVVPAVASAVATNTDATVWTFTLGAGQRFSNGEPVLPSSFARGWNRAARLKGDNSYLVELIQGGAAVIDGNAQEMTGVVADDAALTLTVTLTAPETSFDAVVSHQFFSPMPAAVDTLADQTTWDSGLMVGNGPYMLESPRTDQQVVLVANPIWNGSIRGTASPALTRITFQVNDDLETGYAAVQAGRAGMAVAPDERFADARTSLGVTFDMPNPSTYLWLVNSNSPRLGGDANLKLRQAIALAVDRDAINRTAYGGTRIVATGLVPPVVPGYRAGLCDVCRYDPAGAKAAFAEWKAAGNTLADPIILQYNTGAGHEAMAQLVIEQLAAVGITAVGEPDQDVANYFTMLTDGKCKDLCRSSWASDVPTYDGFLYDGFHQAAIGSGNMGPFVNTDFDRLVDAGRATPDKAKAAQTFNQAESVLLDQVGVIPMSWYANAYVYDRSRYANVELAANGLVRWEEITIVG